MIIPKDTNRLIISKIYTDWDELQNNIKELSSYDNVINQLHVLCGIKPSKMIDYPRIGSYIKRIIDKSVYFYKIIHLMDGELYPCDPTAFAYIELLILEPDGDILLQEGYVSINTTFDKYCVFDYTLTDEEKKLITNRINKFLDF